MTTPTQFNPVQKLFEEVKQKIGECQNTSSSLSSSDFDVTPVKKTYKRKVKTDEIVIENDEEMPKDDSEIIEIKDEPSNDKPKPRRNRILPTAIPEKFLNAPMLLRSEFSPRKSSTETKNKAKFKSEIAKVVLNLKKKNSPKQDEDENGDSVVFISEEVRSPDDADKPSLKLLIRQKRKSDENSEENNEEVELKDEDKQIVEDSKETNNNEDKVDASGEVTTNVEKQDNEEVIVIVVEKEKESVQTEEANSQSDQIKENNQESPEKTEQSLTTTTLTSETENTPPKRKRGRPPKVLKTDNTPKQDEPPKKKQKVATSFPNQNTKSKKATPKKSIGTPKKSIGTPKKSIETPKKSIETQKKSIKTPKKLVEIPTKTSYWTRSSGSKEPEKKEAVNVKRVRKLTVGKMNKKAALKPKIIKTKSNKENLKKPVALKQTLNKAVKPRKLNKKVTVIKKPVALKQKILKKQIQPFSLKSNAMLIATIVKTTLEQLSVQKKIIMKKNKMKRALSLKKEEEEGSKTEDNNKPDVGTIDNVISKVKEILANDPSIVNSVSNNEKPSETTTVPTEEVTPGCSKIQPTPAKKFYSIIHEEIPRTRSKKSTLKSESSVEQKVAPLPSTVVAKNEELLIKNVEALRSNYTENLREKESPKDELDVYDFDEFEPESVPSSYKTARISDTENISKDKTPLKQATLFEMFDKVLKKNKVNAVKNLFDTPTTSNSKEQSSHNESAKTAEDDQPTLRTVKKQLTSPQQQQQQEEDEEIYDEENDDDRREWMPEELAEYKLKYSEKKQLSYKPIYKCKICLMVLPTYYKLYRHKEQHELTKTPYNCKQCDATFADVEELVAHIRVHKGKHPYLCQKCDTGFWSKKAYDEHLPVHAMRKVKEIVRKFQCDVCGKKFAKICDIERHARVHTGEKPFICNICNKPFQQAHNLSKHLLIHLHLKPFGCEICGKTFGRVDVLNRHVLTHSVKKPLLCWVCSRGFIRHSQLSHHVKKDHPEEMNSETAKEIFGAIRKRGPQPKKLLDETTPDANNSGTKSSEESIVEN